LNLQLTVVLLVAALTASAQSPVQVHGFFRVDSAAMGEVIPYVLTASYPHDMQVVFPDTTFAFTPFESAGKTFFPTLTKGTRTYDSVVYLLSTFELDSIQTLGLPVFVVQARDCVAVFALPDTISLRYKVTMSLDSIAVEKLPLVSNTAYQRVQWIFNYPMLLIAIAVLIVLAIAMWLAFGKRIKKYFALRKMQRNYERFLARFNEAVERLRTESSTERAENALVLWKRYMEELEEYPYTRSTSREILRTFSNVNLGNALRTIDRGIYGGYGAPVEPFQFLQTYSQQQFQKREAEVRNG
jgi:hypothetical protein